MLRAEVTGMIKTSCLVTSVHCMATAGQGTEMTGPYRDSATNQVLSVLGC